MEKAQELQLIKGLAIGRDLIEISHLQFADDTIFFLEGSEGSWSYLMELLNFFSTISGLKINKAKCSLVGINSNERKIERLAQSWGCEVGNWPLKYLGLPLGRGESKSTEFLESGHGKDGETSAKLKKSLSL